MRKRRGEVCVWNGTQYPSIAAAALVELARIGLEAETGEDAPEAASWGGWRGSEKSLAALMAYVDSLTDKGRNDPTA